MMGDAFEALADPTRRRILDLLRTHDSMTSGQIAEQFSSAWPTISRHLRILQEAGLIQAEKDGRHMRYELHTTVFQDVLGRVAAWLGRPDNGAQ